MPTPQHPHLLIAHSSMSTLSQQPRLFSVHSSSMPTHFQCQHLSMPIIFQWSHLLNVHSSTSSVTTPPHHLLLLLNSSSSSTTPTPPPGGVWLWAAVAWHKPPPTTHHLHGDCTEPATLSKEEYVLATTITAGRWSHTTCYLIRE